MRAITLSITLVAFTLGSACATTTKIVSDPPGATVTSEKDKRDLGKTPLTYESKMWIWESERLTVKAPGRKPKTIELKRSEVDMLPMVGGACVGILTSWCLCLPGAAIIAAGGMKLPAETKVTLERDTGAGGDATPPPAALLEAPPAGEAVAMGY